MVIKNINLETVCGITSKLPDPVEHMEEVLRAAFVSEHQDKISGEE